MKAKNILRVSWKQPAMLNGITSNLFVNSQTRAFSMFQDKMSQMQEDKQKKGFQLTIKTLANREAYTMKEYKDYVQEAIRDNTKGIQNFMSGNAQSKEAGEFKLHLKILNAMYDGELMLQDKILNEQKKEIGAVVGCDSDEINAMLRGFRTMKGVHMIVRGMKMAGEPLPKDQDELQMLFRSRRPALTKSERKFQKRIRYGRKQMRVNYLKEKKYAHLNVY
eukprot:CAMPEP_0114973276 /NCGR_PEP_ID=MMETSP0216-20121206/866_1 /TAXON_ID=223996 /ORGANISM="Protocruzia adherens, Strain Boccale" /LENGTH=220 /DNA_ID=CAMNT_0002333753 /DNA_START=42 /DNA_END=704 /DNA_ORIENTATION=-